MSEALFTPHGVLTTSLRQIQDSGRRVRPMRAPGVLLKQTPNGVMRRASVRAKRSTGNTDSAISRWL